MQNITSQKFFLYARKSTDIEDKQVLSIEAQITELRVFAKQNNLNIIEEFVEKQSAKIPGRPILGEMIKRIEKGEANGILAWHPDRLARNSVDGGRIENGVNSIFLWHLCYDNLICQDHSESQFLIYLSMFLIEETTVR